MAYLSAEVIKTDLYCIRTADDKKVNDKPNFDLSSALTLLLHVPSATFTPTPTLHLYSLQDCVVCTLTCFDIRLHLPYVGKIALYDY